jgi:hypothetical protein
MKIVLVSCVAKKAEIAEDALLPAKELYVSPLFQKAYAYAESLEPDYIFILSAKHGLLEPDERICKYNESLYSKNAKERTKWADNVLQSLKDKGIDLQNDEVTFLAGKVYCKHLLGPGKIENYHLAYKGLTGIGYILSFLNSKLNANGSK